MQAMDITRNRWFRGGVAVVSVLSVAVLLSRVGLFGVGHYSPIDFTIYALAVLGLERLLGGVLGMIWVLVAPAGQLAARPEK
jgi:hypothetical protein